MLAHDEEASRRADERVNAAIDSLPSSMPIEQKIAAIEAIEEDSQAIAEALAADRARQVGRGEGGECEGAAVVHWCSRACVCVGGERSTMLGKHTRGGGGLLFGHSLTQAGLVGGAIADVASHHVMFASS